MAGPGATAVSGWYTSLTTLGFVPPEYHYILRMVSWFFVTLAIIPLLPLVLLLLCDLALYIWRLYFVSGRAMSGQPVQPDHHSSKTQTSDGRPKSPTAGGRAIPNGSNEKEKFG